MDPGASTLRERLRSHVRLFAPQCLSLCICKMGLGGSCLSEVCGAASPASESREEPAVESGWEA